MLGLKLNHVSKRGHRKQRRPDISIFSERILYFSPLSAIWVVGSFFSEAWWRHQMETFSALLAICVGNSPVPGEFPIQMPVTRSFDVFFDLRLNKRLSKKSWGFWFETLSCPLWRHCNGILVNVSIEHNYVVYIIINSIVLMANELKDSLVKNGGSFYQHGLTLIIADVEVWEWISKFSSYCSGHVIIYRCCDWS